VIRWRWVLAVALGVLLGIYVGAWAASGLHVTGMLGGPDVEGGYFELVGAKGTGEGDLILATPTDSPLYPTFKAMVGRTVQVSVFVVTEGK
jgi:hypothetical protein